MTVRVVRVFAAEPVLGRIAALMLAELGETVLDPPPGDQVGAPPADEVLLVHVSGVGGRLSPAEASQALAPWEGRPSRVVVSTTWVTDDLANWAARRGRWLLELPWSFDTLIAALSGVRAGATQPAGRWRHPEQDRFGALADLLGKDQVALLVPIWVASNADQVARIAEGLAARDRGAVKRAAHSIKGSAGSFDAPEVGETAARLERRAVDAGSPPLEGLAELLTHQLREAEARMAGLIGSLG